MEAMCSTNLIIQAHHTMDNGFGHTQAKIIARALQNQSYNNDQLSWEETTEPRFEEDYGLHINNINWVVFSSKHGRS